MQTPLLEGAAPAAPSRSLRYSALAFLSLCFVASIGFGSFSLPTGLFGANNTPIAHASIEVKAHDLAHAPLFRGSIVEDITQAKELLYAAAFPLAEKLHEFASLLSSSKAAALGDDASEEETGMLGANVPQKDKYPYWRFLPAYVVSVKPGQGEVQWDLEQDERFKDVQICLPQGKASAMVDKKGHVQISVKLSGAKSRWCTDNYLFATGEGLAVHSFTSGVIDYKAPVEKNVLWKLNREKLSEHQIDDVMTVGIRLMVFFGSMTEVATSLTATAALFAPMLTRGVPFPVALKNAQFLRDYAGFNMKKLAKPLTKEDALAFKSKIQDGDMIAITRLDGLDPMLAWGMGATTGHQVFCMWEGEELYVYEATAKDSYWPETNGVQKNRFEHWVELAHKASFNMVFAPISEETRARFNKTAALQYFTEQLEGMDYGYNNMLMSWIDTIKDNYPCLPPSYKICLQPEHVEVVFSFADVIQPWIGQKMWGQALAHRVGRPHSGIRVAEAFHEGRKQGKTGAEVLAIPENDEWLYNITRWDKPYLGQSRVCCTTVCSLWKAGGVFGNMEINCSELNNWDVHSISLFAGEYTQMHGTHELHLNGFNTRKAFPHMAETCPSRAPDYFRPETC